MNNTEGARHNIPKWGRNTSEYITRRPAISDTTGLQDHAGAVEGREGGGGKLIFRGEIDEANFNASIFISPPSEPPHGGR